MAYTVAPNDQGEYVHVVHQGVADAAEILRAQAEAVEALTARRWSRFLVDLRQVENAYSTMDHFNLVSSSAARSEIIRSAIAIVVDPVDLDDFRFAEDVAFNRGLRLKVFTDAGGAAAWLVEQ